MKLDVIASIVLYKNNRHLLEKAINSFLNTSLSVKLYIIDNSPTNDLKSLCKDIRIEYIFNPSNPGFGTAHNIAIRKSIEVNAKYHLVLNPDIYFDVGQIEKMIQYLNKHPNVAAITPKTLYPDGSVQYLCKLLPSPLLLFSRRFMSYFFKHKIDEYELKHKDYNALMYLPCMSGSFMLLRLDVLKKVGLFDEDYFMYLEDFDLSRRIAATKGNYLLYYPKATVFHAYTKASYKSFRMTLIHAMSAILYFNKWGWFSDKNRNELNKVVDIKIDTLKKIGSFKIFVESPNGLQLE